MTAFKVVVGQQKGGHTPVRVFAGTDRDHLALLGSLRCLPEEAEQFAMLIESGAFWERRHASEDGRGGRLLTVEVQRNAPPGPGAE